MKNNLFYSVKQAVKYWWVSLLVGLLAIALGIWCLFTPFSTLVALTFVFAITFFISGLSEIIFAISNRNILNGWGWTLVSGIVDLLFGIILILLPIEIITLALAYFVGFWVMFHSIWAIGSAVELQRGGISGWGWLLILAIMGVIMSFIFIISPLFTTGFIIFLVSVSFISYGISRIFLSFKLKSLHKDIDKIEKYS